VRQAHADEIEEQAALYALDALPPAEAGSFRQRIAAGCPACTIAVADCRQTIAMLPWAAPDAKPSAGLRQRILDSVTKKERRKPVGLLVKPDDTPWITSAPGIETRMLYSDKTMLVRMAAGTVLPEHPHIHAEQCLVLEGSIRTEKVTAYAGDFTYMPAGSNHPPLYSDTGCLLLIAYT
jgi:mannose-6-phosphate isomerase-like protein (cupin superfamily)